MRRITMSLSAAATAGALLFIGLTPASAVDYTDDVEATITGGALTATVSGASLEGLVLDGTNQVATGETESWSIVDARGTGSGWNLTVSATDLTSAGGSVEQADRTIAVSALSLTPGEVAAGEGADPDTAITAPAVTLSGSAQTVVSSNGMAKGTFSVAPSTFSLAVPANAYRSNYEGTVGDSALNPYISTVTFTLG